MTDEQIDDIFDSWSDCVDFTNGSGDKWSEYSMNLDAFRSAVKDLSQL